MGKLMKRTGHVKHLTAEKGQFSGWQFPADTLHYLPWPLDKDTPAHIHHRSICCDCGLAHDYEFVVIKLNRLGRMVRPTKHGEYGILYRCRRNEKSTARVRNRKAAFDCEPKKRRK